MSRPSLHNLPFIHLVGHSLCYPHTPPSFTALALEVTEICSFVPFPITASYVFCTWPLRCCRCWMDYDGGGSVESQERWCFLSQYRRQRERFWFRELINLLLREGEQKKEKKTTMVKCKETTTIFGVSYAGPPPLKTNYQPSTVGQYCIGLGITRGNLSESSGSSTASLHSSDHKAHFK